MSYYDQHWKQLDAAINTVALSANIITQIPANAKRVRIMIHADNSVTLSDNPAVIVGAGQGVNFGLDRGRLDWNIVDHGSLAQKRLFAITGSPSVTLSWIEVIDNSLE